MDGYKDAASMSRRGLIGGINSARERARRWSRLAESSDDARVRVVALERQLQCLERLDELQAQLSNGGE